MNIDQHRKDQFERLFAALPYLLWNERPIPNTVGDIHEVIHLVNDLMEALPMIQNVFMTGYYEGMQEGRQQGVQSEKIRQWSAARKALQPTCKHKYVLEPDEDWENDRLVCMYCDHIASPDEQAIYQPTPDSEM